MEEGDKLENKDYQRRIGSSSPALSQAGVRGWPQRTAGRNNAMTREGSFVEMGNIGLRLGEEASNKSLIRSSESPVRQQRSTFASPDHPSLQDVRKFVPEQPPIVTLRALLKRSVQSLYLMANVTYVLYALLIISIHFEQPGEAGSSTSSASLAYINADINCRYRIASYVHLLNALMYVWVWIADGYSLCHRLQIPEYLNICEAGLYMWSATLYAASADEGFSGPVTTQVQRLELAASVVELFAAIGWATTWYLTYPRVPGRGWTLDDPDMWAAPTIVLAGAMYVVYNVQIALFPSSYGSDQLYFYADIVYLVNAWLYLFAAMRDVGWCDAAGCCQVHCPLPVILGPWPEEAPYGGHGSGGLELAVPTEDPFDAEPGIGTGSPWKPAAVLQEPLPEGVGGAGAGSGSGGRDGGFGTARDGS